MIELQNVRKTYQTDRIETLALSQIDLAIAKGEFLSIMGPSGSGKSTLLHLIGLLDTPTSGVLRVAGHDASRAGDAALARLRNTHIGFVFQTFHLVPDLSVVDNVEIPLLYRSGERKLAARERRERALAALDRVGLSFRSTPLRGARCAVRSTSAHLLTPPLGRRGSPGRSNGPQACG